MKALSMVLRAPAVVSLITADTESEERASVSNAIKNRMLNCLSIINTDVIARLLVMG